MRAVRLEDTATRCIITGRALPENGENAFTVGRSYRTIGGQIVMITKENRDRHGAYDHVCGHDGKWRYDRKGDRGRCTGSERGGPNDLIPGAVI